MARYPWLQERRHDNTLMAKLAPNEFSLVRLRRELLLGWSRLPTEVKQLHSEDKGVRLCYLNSLIRALMGLNWWPVWLRYIERTERDVVEMEMGEFPICPMVVRQYSALFGIDDGFLIRGQAPQAGEVGGLDEWPRAMVTKTSFKSGFDYLD